MTDADSFTRPYLVVDTPGAATGEQIATLLETAAAALRRHGELTVHHLAVDIADQITDINSLTVYYDRIERRPSPPITIAARPQRTHDLVWSGLVRQFH